jgi:hypothetical protein
VPPPSWPRKLPPSMPGPLTLARAPPHCPSTPFHPPPLLIRRNNSNDLSPWVVFEALYACMQWICVPSPTSLCSVGHSFKPYERVLRGFVFQALHTCVGWACVRSCGHACVALASASILAHMHSHASVRKSRALESTACTQNVISPFRQELLVENNLCQPLPPSYSLAMLSLHCQLFLPRCIEKCERHAGQLMGMALRVRNQAWTAWTRCWPLPSTVSTELCRTRQPGDCFQMRSSSHASPQRRPKRWQLPLGSPARTVKRCIAKLPIRILTPFLLKYINNKNKYMKGHHLYLPQCAAHITVLPEVLSWLV